MTHPTYIISQNIHAEYCGKIIDASDLITTFDSYNPTNDIVGYKHTDTYRPDVRNSKSIDNIKLTSNDPLFIESAEYKIKNSIFKLHCYETSGYFTKHQDSVKYPDHGATVLIFPPGNISPFTGGNLLLYVDCNIFEIKPSEFTQWTLIIIPLGVYHECSTVLSGRRFVFKADIPCPKPIINTTGSSNTECDSDDSECDDGGFGGFGFFD